MRTLRYYYYRLYCYFSKGDDIPIVSSFLVIMVFGHCNFIAFLDIFFSIILNIKIVLPVVDSGIGRLKPLLIVIPLAGLFYFLLKVKGYHNLIVNEFKDETPKQKSKSSTLVILYLIGSIALFIITLWARQEIRGY